jgi:hypothetical protein
MVADERGMTWDEVVKDFAEPIAQSALRPDPARHAMYRELIDVYAACEAHALGDGPDPSPLIGKFAGSRR